MRESSSVDEDRDSMSQLLEPSCISFKEKDVPKILGEVLLRD